jgi:cell division protease FtsH
MGGRAAEEIFLNHMTTGAGNDIERATDLARKMVCEWGMSEALGPLTFGQKEEQIFLGKEFARHKDYSEQTAISIDSEIQRIVTERYDRARSIIAEHKEVVERMAQALLERETLNAEEIEALIEGRELAPIEPPLPPVQEQAQEQEPVPLQPMDDGKIIVGRPPGTPDPRNV